MTDLKAALKQFQKADANLTAAIHENGNAFIVTLFQTIFDTYPNLNKLATYGYTPSFNDGDICTHSSEYLSGSWYISSYDNSRHYDYEDGCSEAEEFFTGTDSDDEDNETIVALLNDSEPLDEIAINREALAAKSMMEEYDTIFERVYDTNYFVFAERKADGTIVVCNTEYDPGY